MPDVLVKYQDAVYSNYKIEICDSSNSTYDNSAYAIKDNFPDAKLTRVDTDYLMLHNKALISVNGYIHSTVYDGNNIIIKNATKSMLKSNTNHIGIHSFMAFPGVLTKTQITPAMITEDAPYDLYRKLIITVPTAVKSLILSIGGYLQFEEAGVLYRVSDKSFILHLNKTNYIERLYELSGYRDIFTDLSIPTSTLNPSVFEYNVATSNATIIKFMTLDNSFVTSVPVDTLTVNKVFLDQTSLPGTFNTSIDPLFPLVVGYGKLAEYWKQKHELQWIVNTVDAYQNNYLFSKLSNSELKVINGHRLPNSTYTLSNAYMLKISTTL